MLRGARWVPGETACGMLLYSLIQRCGGWKLKKLRGLSLNYVGFVVRPTCSACLQAHFAGCLEGDYTTLVQGNNLPMLGDVSEGKMFGTLYNVKRIPK